ncbi:hypothetical protein ILYODFUR_003294 [Ilyodon furcidens]|uniref:Uncharacterized protein n=1 Tax=Ilyodon furcidens TaxID=33524 RepID=A0ABV0TRH9_9TELE
MNLGLFFFFYCIRHLNVHSSCATGKVHSNIPPPPTLSLHVSASLRPSVFLVFLDAKAKIPAFCSFSEQLRGGQRVTLEKVTDERAGSGGWQKSSFKEVWGGMGGGGQARSITV